MQRRRFLRLGGLGAGAALAGCHGPGNSTPTVTRRATTETASASDEPDGIYVQSFQETMSMQGTATEGDYRFSLVFTVPHTFWTVTGNSVSKVEQTPADTLHLMAAVWDPETQTVLPETGLSVEITQGDSVVSQEVIYPMLSQPMGFHYGGNFELDGLGEYTATVSVGGSTIRRTGRFADRFGEPASVELPLSVTQERVDEISSRPIDQAGQPGALRPMEMLSTPKGIAPSEAEMPGTVRGSAMADDCRFVVTTLESAERVDADGQYLAVSARTRYNRYLVPAMALRGTVERDGQPIFEGPLQRTLSPDLRYHYGAAVADGLQSGDELTLTVQTPPQVARHEGYETAFLQFDPVTMTL